MAETQEPARLLVILLRRGFNDEAIRIDRMDTDFDDLVPAYRGAWGARSATETWNSGIELVELTEAGYLWYSQRIEENRARWLE